MIHISQRNIISLDEKDDAAKNTAAIREKYLKATQNNHQVGLLQGALAVGDLVTADKVRNSI